ncbi:MAG: LPS assembly protein LptD [Pseudomonadota bacterium]
MNPPGTDEPWRVDADHLFYDQDTDQYVAEGNVVIKKKDTKLSADFVRFDHKTMEALAIGNAVMTDGKDILTGDRIKADLKSETGIAYHGTVFFKENHFFIRGDKIQKTGERTYAANRAGVTSCDGESPAWEITGEDVEVTLEGYATAWHGAFWLKNIPLFYAPFIILPVKTERQSGLLEPILGNSERKGFEYEQPYFWAIGQSSDATLYWHHMARRGEKLGLEYRYVPDSRSKGTLMYDFLDDKQIDDGTGDSSSRWGYEDDRYLRPNNDRYWFRMKHDHLLPYDFFARLDVDIVSDQDYLLEFKSGYNGFDDTQKYFQNVFGRGVDDYGDTIRLNRLNISRNWNKNSLNAEARWYDNVLYRRHSDPDDPDQTLHRLPFVEYDISKQQLLHSPLYYSLDSEYTRFYRKDGLRGHRVNLYPKVSLPYRFGNYLTLEPSLGIRETYWHVDQFEDNAGEKDRTQLRDLYDARLDVSTEVYKTFGVNGNRIDKIRHAVIPKIIYEYLPEKEQSQFPRFDDSDRIGDKNLISYSLSNTLTYRSKTGSEKSEEPSYIYREFFRLTLSQSYDINKANDDEIEEKEPFSNIQGRVEIDPSDAVYLEADTEWSPYESDFMNFNSKARLMDVRGDQLFVEYRYRRDSSDEAQDGKSSVYTRLGLNLFYGLSAYAEYERNLYQHQDIKTGVGFLYRAQCWSVDFRYTDEIKDRTYSVMVNLSGLGGMGHSIGNVKDES